MPACSPIRPATFRLSCAALACLTLFAGCGQAAPAPSAAAADSRASTQPTTIAAGEQGTAERVALPRPISAPVSDADAEKAPREESEVADATKRAQPGAKGDTSATTASPAAPPMAEPSKDIAARSESKAKRAMGGWAGPTTEVASGEDYAAIAENSFVAVADDPRSTFSIDVDTASYANTRRFLQDGTLPPADAVRIEELVNYFDYDYAAPEGNTPFSMTHEVSSCPWNQDHLLVHVGLQGQTIDASDVPARNLVFLLDVSGSMNSPDKLPLLTQGLGMLVDGMRKQDRISIVVYAGASGVVLEPTADKAEINDALRRLSAGGSTNGGAGIELAYRLAEKTMIEGGINRVILATDGDFNVGTTSQGELVKLIEAKRKSGVFLSVLGFGSGNLKDSTMEMLADKGNGNYAYIDSIAEARKVLVKEGGSTLVTIAKDVKIQVEWNPKEVASYRLIGYENRKLAHTDFNDDTKDAGEIGAGHTVTALYEVVPAGGRGSAGVDPLKYQGEATALTPAASSGELMTVKIRYKQPSGDKSDLLSFAVSPDDRPLDKTTDDFRFAAAVAEFGMVLRGSEHRGQATFDTALDLAAGALGKDPERTRAEFVTLVRTAKSLQGRRVAIAK